MCYGICKHERMDGDCTLSPGERDCPCAGCGEHGDDCTCNQEDISNAQESDGSADEGHA